MLMYLDALHKNHLEICSAQGVLKFALSLTGKILKYYAHGIRRVQL